MPSSGRILGSCQGRPPLARAACVALIFGLPLSGCSGVLEPHGPVDLSERLILFDSLAIMLAIVVP